MQKLQTLIKCLLVCVALASCASERTDSHLYTYASLEAQETVPAQLKTVIESCRSILFVHTRVDILMPDGTTRGIAIFGSAFVYEGSEHAISAKHVFYPEIFEYSLAQALSRGGVITDKKIYLWPTDTQFLDKNGNLNFSASYVLGKDFSLIIPKTRQTIEKTIKVSDSSGNSYTYPIKQHLLGSTDVAAVKFKKKITIPGLKVRQVNDKEKGMICYMLGYPAGPRAMDTKIVNPVVSVNFIRKAEVMLRTSGTVIGGNSGGPIIDARGNVIGVVSYRRHESVTFSVRGRDIIKAL